MASPQVAPLEVVPSSAQPQGPVRTGVERLRKALPRREDATVLADFLEDDLLEGLSAIEDVQSHFLDVIETLEKGRLTPIALIEAAEDSRAIDRLEYLQVVVSQLRRRLSMAAGKLRERR